MCAGWTTIWRTADWRAAQSTQRTLYSTDAEIQYYNLRVLEDDENLFPKYYAVLLYRDDLEVRAPKVVSALLELEDCIPEAEIGQNECPCEIRQGS